jgi:N-acetylneuraminic acid mutarotase
MSRLKTVGFALPYLVALEIIVSLSFLGCGTAVAPIASSAPVRTPGSNPIASAPASASGQPDVPSPSQAVPIPADAAWLDAGELREARNATNVAAVGSGEILVVGSDYQTSWLSACGSATNGSDSVEIGDPLKSVWTKTTNLRTPREAPGVVGLHDGRALVTGGETGENEGNVSYSSTYVFDPADHSWTRSGLLNSARSNSTAVRLADGRVLVAGGRYIDKAHSVRILDSSELWDPESGTWSRTGALAHRRIGASAVVLDDGRVLIVGGVASSETAPFEQASAEVYDPQAGRWRTAGSLMTARSGYALVALPDGGALVAGGFDGSLGSGRLQTVERFDPRSDTWSEVESLSSPVAGATGVRLADGRVLLAGGSAREPELTDGATGAYISGLTDEAELFDPETGKWTSTVRLPSPRAGASAVVLADGSVVLAGGSASEGSPADTPSCPEADPQVWRYVPGA